MKTAKHDINYLPELPLEALSLDGELGPAKTEPVLTILPKEFVKPEKPTLPSDSKVAHICLPSFDTRTYITQVTYPRVICYPNTPPDAQVIKRAILKQKEFDCDESEKSDIELGQMQYYKLSSYEGKNLHSPIFCTLHSGPWAALAREITSCNCYPSPSKWEFQVSGLPEIYLMWYGVWADIPSYVYPNLHVFINDLYLKNESFSCCSGYHWCKTTRSCIPVSVECRDPGMA